MNTPMFSIVIPVYKVEEYLDICVKSVLSQSYSDYQIVLVDDGSPDRCGQMCDAYAREDSRIKVIHKTNGGLSSARNAGTDAATGEYVVYLDSDDFWDDKDALKNIAIRLKETNADLLIFSAKRFYGNDRPSVNLISTEVDRDRVTDKNVFRAMEYLIENNIYRACPWNKVVRRSILQTHALYFEEGYLSEDRGWCGDLLQYVNRFDFYDNPFYAYRQRRPGSIMAEKSEKLVADMLYMCEKGCQQAGTLSDSRKRALISSYYAYEYAVAIGLSAGVKNRDVLMKMQALQPLLRYDICNKVKKVNRLKRMIGYRLTRIALCLFVMIKK